MSRSARALVTITFLAGALSARAADAKPPWEWSFEERLARRFDPRAMAERAAKTSATSTAARNVIVGAENPELFLPFELFTHLVREGVLNDGAERDGKRARLGPLIATFTEPAAFWAALESAAAEYIANQRAERRVAERLRQATTDAERASIRAEFVPLQAPQCRLRFEALRAAEAAIGRTELHRVLYLGIAPGLSMTSSAADDPSRLRFLERGCR